MFSRPSLPRAGVLYVATVVALGAAVVLVCVYRLAELSDKTPLLPLYTLAGLALLSGSAFVKLQSVSATISISETFVFTSVIMYGPPAGAVIVALDGLIMSTWLSKGRRQIHRVAFNMAAPTLSIWLSSQLYYLLGTLEPAFKHLHDRHVDDIPVIIGPLAVLALTHFILNSCLIAVAVALETKRPAFEVWRKEFRWLSLSYLGAASITALAVPLGLSWTYFAVIVPLLFLLYSSFKIPMDGVKHAEDHVVQIKQLHLSTIDTLAMAIDAKDQVTHGHIRRVQTYAVGLARALGVSDPGLLQAIEASALLHDMGKLAIPEHILNKPGKLTPAEFDKIKEHATVGANILSEIAFPYPVIPIVRYHHENWDGSGYPTGIKGTEIPIGARILAVVDCYDALTSDRPYRPQLSDEAATTILLQRRGSMYDPLVVDTFVRVHRSIALPEALSGPQTETYADIARLSAPETRQAAEVGQSHGTFERAIADLVSLSLSQNFMQSVAERAQTFLSVALRATGARAGLVAKYDEGADDLEILVADGFGAAKIAGLRMQLGEHLTGWVAANAKPIVNSDAALDLGFLAPYTSFGLAMCLSVPVSTEAGSIVGVLSIYSTEQFTSDDLATVRALSAAIATSICNLRASPTWHQLA